MSSERGRSGTLPEELKAWIERKAEATGEHPTEILTRAVMAYRMLEEGAEDAFDAELETIHEEVATVDEQLASIDTRLSTVEGDLSSIEEDLDAFEAHVEAGFENYETVLEALDEETIGLRRRTTRLAESLVDVRDRLDAIDRMRTLRDRTEELLDEANRAGIERGDCGECGRTVSIGLLSTPRCPHCESSFGGVEPGGWFRSPTITTDAPLALEGETEGTAHADPIDEIANDDAPREELENDSSFGGFEWRSGTEDREADETSGNNEGDGTRGDDGTDAIERDSEQ